MIVLKQITKSFAGRTVLEDISLHLEPRKTHVLLGASGSGKSTLLRLLLGLTAPDRGEITIDGETVGQRARRAALAGYVVQEGGLFPHLTAAGNVCLAARTRGWSREKQAERLSELSRLVQLEDSLLNRYPAELSGGQRQRVGLMRAMMLDPKLYILDEPLGALDPIVRAELQRELKRIFNALRKTVVLVTHDLSEAAFFGHTISLLHRGRILQNGPFEELVHRPADPFVTEFLQAQKPPAELKELL